MLDLLARFLGPNRAVSVYVFVGRFGWPVLFAIGFVAVLGTVIAVSQPRSHEHVGFITATVTGRTEIGTGTGAVFDLALPDGGSLRLTETEAAVTEQVSETACLEHRRFTDNGEARYRIKNAELCAAR